VPAVVISPLLARRNLVDHTVYDHTSVLATLRTIFPQIGAFTMRDRMAATLAPLFAGPPQVLAPYPLAAAGPPATAPMPLAVVADDAAPPEHSEFSALRIAARLHHRIGKVSAAKVFAAIYGIKTKGDARNYLRTVDGLVKAKTKPSSNKRRALGRSRKQPK
jgi:phospholipase C